MSISGLEVLIRRPSGSFGVGLLALLLCSTVAYGWNGTGHMVIAATAYRQLPTETRARLAEVLRSHPDYPHWRAEAPELLPNDDEGLYLFMRASTWADEIRRPDGNRWRPTDLHLHWHYIDIPLSEQGPGAVPTDDADLLAGIAENTTAFAGAATPAQRAVALAWIIHLLGDIHQPLHCVSMVSAAFPQGDRGANLVRLAPPVRGSSNLHAVWDGLLGGREGSLGDVVIAVRTLSKLPSLSLEDLSEQLTSANWAEESARVAFDKAYLRSQLVRALGVRPVALTAGYVQDAQDVAQRRAALAGYRLAKLLERPVVVGQRSGPTIDPTPVVPATTVLRPEPIVGPTGRNDERSTRSGAWGEIAVAVVIVGAVLAVLLYRRRRASASGAALSTVPVADDASTRNASKPGEAPTTMRRRPVVSCFISYASEDESFAKQLKYDLDANGFVCWFAPDDLLPGVRIDPALRSEIEKHDKVILILSAHAIESAWVEEEVAAVRMRENASSKTILLPIRIDSAVLATTRPWAASIRRERNIGDFSAWQEDRQYQRALERLVQSLRENGDPSRP